MIWKNTVMTRTWKQFVNCVGLVVGALLAIVLISLVSKSVSRSVSNYYISKLATIPEELIGYPAQPELICLSVCNGTL